MTMTARCATLVSALAACTALPANADWIADGSLGMFFDDNLSHALAAGDKKADIAFAASASAGQYLQLDDSLGLALTGNFKSETYAQFGGLNQYSLGATASLKKKLGLGAYAPWISAYISARHADYQSSLRDSGFYTAGIVLGKRLNEKWDIQFEYTYLQRLADRKPPPFDYEGKALSSAVFDQVNHGPKLSAVYSHDQSTAITASYAFRSGDVFSTNVETDAIGDIAKAIATDNIFGSNRIAYKIPGHTHSFALGASRAIGAHASVNLDYEHHWTTAERGLTYHVNVVGLSLLYSF